MQKTNRELFQAALKDAVAEITVAKEAVLGAYANLASIRGVDDYVDSLQAIVTKYQDIPDPDAPQDPNDPQAPKKTGITVSKLNLVFCDNVVLAAARKTLENNGTIVENREGQTKRLNLVKKDVAATE